MVLTLTIAALDSHQACHMELRTADLAAHLGRMPGDNEAIPATTWWALPSTHVVDAVWSLRAVEPATEARASAIRVALAAAMAVEHLLQIAVRAAYSATLKAVEEYINQPTPERLAAVKAARSAAIATVVKTETVDDEIEAEAAKAYAYAVSSVYATDTIDAVVAALYGVEAAIATGCDRVAAAIRVALPT